MQFPVEIIRPERNYILEGEKFGKTGNSMCFLNKPCDTSGSKTSGYFNNLLHSRNEFIPGYILPSKKMLVVSYGTTAKTRTEDFRISPNSSPIIPIFLIRTKVTPRLRNFGVRSPRISSMAKTKF